MNMDYELNRREFLEVTAAVGFLTFAEPRAARALSAEENRALLACVRTLFQHERIKDEPYARVVENISNKARRSSEHFHDLVQGLANLDRASGGDFAKSPKTTRIALLQAQQNAWFFQAVYREALETLYGSNETWRMFSPFEK